MALIKLNKTMVVISHHKTLVLCLRIRLKL